MEKEFDNNTKTYRNLLKLHTPIWKTYNSKRKK